MIFLINRNCPIFQVTTDNIFQTFTCTTHFYPLEYSFVSACHYLVPDHINRHPIYETLSWFEFCLTMIFKLNPWTPMQHRLLFMEKIQLRWDITLMLKNLSSDKINVTKNALFFLSRAPNLHIFTFNLQFLYELKHKVHLSKNVCGIFNFRFFHFKAP